MIARVLFRLSIAWLAILGGVWLLGRFTTDGAAANHWDPDGLGGLFVFGLPGLIGLVLAWVFMPARR